MLIGIDGRAFYGAQAGTGRYVSELCRVLDTTISDATFIVYGNRSLNLPVTNNRWVQHGNNPLTFWLPASIWFFLFAGWLAKKDNCEVFWGCANFLPIGLGSRIKAVLTIHDFVFRLFPKTLTVRNRLAYFLFFKNSLRRAQVITTNSKGTALRLKQFYQLTTSAVVRPRASNQFRPPQSKELAAVLSKYKIDFPFFVAVATIEPRKNLDLLLEAFLLLNSCKAIPSLGLVLVGQVGWKNDLITKKIAQANALGLRLITTGYVPDNALPALYNGAIAMVMPSLYEGFGMPVLEALQCGAQVVATDATEIREAGNDSVIYVEPTVDGIKQGLIKALRTRESNVRSKFEASEDSHWLEEGSIMARLMQKLI
jgi:glycosyltransferase involved in cell wall biosynthesis